MGIIQFPPPSSGPNILAMTPNTFTYGQSSNTNIPADGTLDLLSISGEGILGPFSFSLVSAPSIQLQIVVDGVVHSLQSAIGNAAYAPTLSGYPRQVDSTSQAGVVLSNGFYRFKTSLLIRIKNLSTTSVSTATHSAAGVYYT